MMQRSAITNRSWQHVQAVPWQMMPGDACNFEQTYLTRISGVVNDCPVVELVTCPQ